MRLIDADALCRTISLHIMAYKTLLNNKITIPNQIDKEKVNSVIDGFRECIDIVYNEPRVIAEPIRHGHWRKVDDKEPLAWDCSVCGAMCHYNTPYCPICGAKMDEVEEMDIKKYCIPKEEYNIPTVNEGIQEGRKLVFCKDCKYWEEESSVGFCTRTEDCDWNADDFCSKGEKRDEID